MRLATCIEVLVEPGECWGRLVCEDSGEGACDLCCQICPTVFEKPRPNACARVKPGVDLSAHLRAIQQAASECPVNAIRTFGIPNDPR